ncbi:hypothetical protein V6N11_068374 [Hibiscus sabdariffa]|uniref:GH16 domain-containing protein n=1 Tax=Hibiscus sabdariffa TaxID=183260 RepID=A0ABR2A2C8_9ROSI
MREGNEVADRLATVSRWPTVGLQIFLVPQTEIAGLIQEDESSTIKDHDHRSGFISSSIYSHEFFSAKIKLPSDYTARIVVAFYTSNPDEFEKSHGELDIEFLGNIEGKPWRFQTNTYGNESTNRGREESYGLWLFQPSETLNLMFKVKNVKQHLLRLISPPLYRINDRHRNTENPLLKETNCGSLLQKLQ